MTFLEAGYTYYLLTFFIGYGFPGGSDGKASVYNAGDQGSIPGSRRFPGEGNGNPLQPTPVFLPGESQGQGEPGGLPSMGSHRVGHD